MKLNWNKRSTTRAVYAFLVFAAAIIFYYAVNHLPVILSYCNTVIQLLQPFIYGFAIAYLINPLLKWVQKVSCKITDKFKKKKVQKISTKISRGFAVLISYMIAAAVLTLFGFIIIPEITNSITNLVNNTEQYVNSLKGFGTNFINTHFESSFIIEQFNELINSADELIAQAAELLKAAVPYLYNFMANFTTMLKNIILGIIISIYMLFSKEKFCAQTKKILYALLPNQYTDKLVKLTKVTHQTFGGFITGKILDSLIIGVLCFIGMSILNIPYAVLISVIIGVTNIIPYFGPFIGAIPSVFLILLVDPIKALWFAIFILILQQFDGNILGPKILGQTTGLSAFWVIFSIIIGGGLFGFIGMFIGVPVFSVIYSLVKVFLKFRLEKKNMPVQTQAYMTDNPDSKPEQ